MWLQLQRQSVQLRLFLGLLGAVCMWVVIIPWNPPFPYREGDTVSRDILGTVAFEEPDDRATLLAQEEVANQVPYVFANNPKLLVNLRKDLQVSLLEVLTAKTRPDSWSEFMPPVPEDGEPPSDEVLDKEFKNFVELIKKEGASDQLQEAVAKALAPYERHGILEKLPDEKGRRRDQILVYPEDLPEGRKGGELVPVEDLILAEDKAKLLDRLSTLVASVDVAEHVFYWLKSRLPRTTLTFKSNLTQIDTREAQKKVGLIYKSWVPGQTLVKRGLPTDLQEYSSPLTKEDIERLKYEHQATLNRLSFKKRLLRASSALGMIISLYALCTYFIYYHEPRLILQLKRLWVLLFFSVLTVALARWLSADLWRAELIPLLFFAMTMTIAYRQEIALLLSAALALVIVYAIGHSLGDFILLLGVTAAAVFMLGRVRSRSKLIHVGFASGLIALGLTFGVGILEGQPLEFLRITPEQSFELGWLPYNALRNFAWALVTGFLVSGSLPFLEKLLGFVTDISLLELGDVGHPLLQELVRRAPGTYNHSINVATLADTAAEAIGANGLLVRVGAYFHDIGKMLKPSYFIENQGDQANRHDSLMPAMSTLIIIAHVKDGSDLAKQHNLPEPIIDFIEQHHGTTLVQFFYDRASRQSEDNPDNGSVEESTFRYPGPKPQTKEAGVMMLADAVESASRTLAEPTPARIQSLVEKITLSRLMDGQFDECGLNLKEIKTVQESLIKSLIAVYHGRVKYPEPKSDEESHSEPKRSGLSAG